MPDIERASDDVWAVRRRNGGVDITDAMSDGLMRPDYGEWVEVVEMAEHRRGIEAICRRTGRMESEYRAEVARLREALDAIRRDDFDRAIHPTARHLAAYVVGVGVDHA